MSKISSRKRVMKAFQHKRVDRIPLDFGSCMVSTITTPAYERLKSYLGIRKKTKVMRLIGNTALVDEEVLRHFDIDTRGLMLIFPEGNPQNWINQNTFIDEYGLTWHCPRNGYYYDMVRSPLTGNINLEDIKNYTWPDPYKPERIAGLYSQAKGFYEAGFFTVLNLPLGFIHITQFLRGFEDWFCDLLLQPDLIGFLMDKVIEVIIGITKDALEEVGNFIDAVLFMDDIATQDSLVCSPEVYRNIIKPRQKRIFDFIKTYNKLIIYHTCGAVEPLINDLIELGIDALNPIQISARGMDSFELKRLYGEDLTFWGAGCDSQKVLGKGTVEEVKSNVKKQINSLAPNGGFIFSPIHNIQPEVSVENICAMFNSAKKYGLYY